MQQLHDLGVSMLISCPVQERLADRHLKGMPCRQTSKGPVPCGDVRALVARHGLMSNTVASIWRFCTVTPDQTGY